MDKTVLRNRYKIIRLKMSTDEVVSKSQAICGRALATIELTKVKNLSVYEPLAKLNEVDASLFISEIRHKYPDIEIRVMGSAKNQRLPRQKFDLIIVPTLAFDANNYRLGWGGGFYDRFLAVQPQALKIGLCFQKGFIKEGLTQEPHDIPLDAVITD